MKKDRNYYRSMDIRALQDEVKYSINPDWQELAIVLAERLDTIADEIIDEMRDDY